MTRSKAAAASARDAAVIPTEPNAELVYMIEFVLGQSAPRESTTFEALKEACIYNRASLLSVEDDKIRELSYKVVDDDDTDEASAVDTPLEHYIIERILYLRAYYRYIQDGGVPPPFTRMSKVEFDDFIHSEDLPIYLGTANPNYARIRMEARALLRRANTSTASTSGPNPFTVPSSGTASSFLPASSPQSNPTSVQLTNWHRGVKKDPKVFRTLSKDFKYAEWREHLESQLPAQGLQELIDPNYSPSDDVEKELFKLKQQWLYAALINVIEEDKGKEILRRHHKDHDARKALEEIHDYFTKDTNKNIRTDELRAFLSTAKFGPGYRGTAQHFLAYWKEKARQYNLICEPDERYKDGTLVSMLKTAVSLVEELHTVETNQDMIVALGVTGNHTGTGRLSYPQYCSLLTQAAIRYDRSRLQKSKRQALYHDLYADFAVHEDEEISDPEFDLETPLDVVMAHQAMQFAPRAAFMHDRLAYATRQRDRRSPGSRDSRSSFRDAPRMTGKQWHALSPEMQEKWDLLDDESKKIILGKIKPVPYNQTRSLNLHDISAADFLSFTSESGDSLAEFRGVIPRKTHPRAAKS